jgi:uncharacterized protein
MLNRFILYREGWESRKTMTLKPVILSVKVIPQAPKTCVVGNEGGTLKIKLTAPPVDGKANEALVVFLAEQLEVPKKNISIRSGHGSRRKLVQVVGADPEVMKKFCLAIGPSSP